MSYKNLFVIWSNKHLKSDESSFNTNKLKCSKTFIENGRKSTNLFTSANIWSKKKWIRLRFYTWERYYTCPRPEWGHYLQWEGDGVVAVAGQEVGEDGFHGGFLLHLAVSGAQQVSVKHIWRRANTEFIQIREILSEIVYACEWVCVCVYLLGCWQSPAQWRRDQVWLVQIQVLPATAAWRRRSLRAACRGDGPLRKQSGSKISFTQEQQTRMGLGLNSQLTFVTILYHRWGVTGGGIQGTL